MSQSFENRLSQSQATQDDLARDACSVKIQSLLKQKDYRQLVQIFENKKLKEYSKLKYNGDIYKVGQNLAIKGEGGQEYVGKLIKIMNLLDDFDKCIPLVKVRWYYRKNDLKNIPKEQLDSISQNEVFKTEHTDFIEIETIIGLATILTFDEYDQIENLNDYVYFSRANFMHKRFEPPFQQWPRTCLCQKPPNPDLKYILCDTCKQWCHLKCVKLTEEQANRIRYFICRNCDKS